MERHKFSKFLHQVNQLQNQRTCPKMKEIKVAKLKKSMLKNLLLLFKILYFVTFGHKPLFIVIILLV